MNYVRTYVPHAVIPKSKLSRNPWKPHHGDAPVNDIDHRQRTGGYVGDVAVDLLLDVAVLLGREGGVMEQHLEPLHGVVVTELVKRGRLPVLAERDVLETWWIQDRDLVLLRRVGAGGRLE